MYIIGLSGNSRLMKDAKATIDRAVKMYEENGNKVVLFHSFYYQAKSWGNPRRVVVKAEVSELGKNIRFIVTDMEIAKATVLYQQIYCARGEDELYIKDPHYRIIFCNLLILLQMLILAIPIKSKTYEFLSGSMSKIINCT